MKLKSYAKINLYLHVLGKRKDGFHSIETLFERISLSDEITLRRTEKGICILTDSEQIPRGPKNLAYRAAKLLQDKYNVCQGVTIEIKKNIPVAAGLGGGSSNAATVLMGLNKLWRLCLSQKELLNLAPSLGSDVAFFLLETPMAMGRGRGERLQKISFFGKPFWHCLVKPRFGISTKKAYQAVSSTFLTPKKADVKMLLHSIKKGRSDTLSKLLTNSLEGTLNKRVMTILKIKENLLKKGAVAALMSGSGSTVFGIFSSQKKALETASFLRKKNKSWKVFVASTV